MVLEQSSKFLQNANPMNLENFFSNKKNDRSKYSSLFNQCFSYYFSKQMYAWFDLDNTNLSLNFDKDDRYIFRLSDSVRRICRELARMEKASALERIPAIMRQTSEKVNG